MRVILADDGVLIRDLPDRQGLQALAGPRRRINHIAALDESG